MTDAVSAAPRDGAHLGAMLPPRVQQRPSPALWTDEELMTLAEASMLFWPDGLLTTKTLRTAVRDSQLDVVQIAGKLFTTKSAIARMSKCAPRLSGMQPGPPAPAKALPATVAEFRRQRLGKN